MNFTPNNDHISRALDRITHGSKLSEMTQGRPPLVLYSGGKDSDVLLRLYEMADVPFEVSHSHTTADAPETVYHVRKVFDSLERNGVKCEIIKPTYKGESTSMWKLIPQKKMPPTRIVRYCCSILKETAGKGRVCSSGVRWAESTKRKTRAEFESIGGRAKDAKKATYDQMLNNDNDYSRDIIESCLRQKKTMVNPIIDWTDKEVFDFYKSYCDLRNPLYEFFDRVGCVGCPMAGKHRYKEFKHYPKYKKLYIESFERMLDENFEKRKNWESGEDVFMWWMEDKNIKGQMNISDFIEVQNND